MICFDTAPLIWGIQGKANKEQEYLVSRTNSYIRHLSKEKTKIILPAPVIAEYLVGFSAEEQKIQEEILQKYFIIVSFDYKAARLASELERAKSPRDIQAEFGIDRQNVKTDVQIVATAIVFGAHAIVSHDDHMKVIAGDRIKIIDVPSISEQLPLQLPGS